MPLTIKKPNPDSLQTLLGKANAIKTINQENLAHIQSLKGKEFIARHRCNLQNKPSFSAKLILDPNSEAKINEDMCDKVMTLVKDSITKNVDGIITSWRYSGEPLARETFAFKDFIDLNLEGFDDLVRLLDAYGSLLDKYSQVFADEVESRAAAEIILKNMEVLQVAIGEIHENVINVRKEANLEKIQYNDALTMFMASLSMELKALETKLPGVRIDFKAQLVDEDKEDNIVEFNHDERLSCRHTFAKQKGLIHAMELYEMNGKQHVAIADYSETIKLWDLSKNTFAATLPRHKGGVSSLVSYVQNGEQMLASGGYGCTIKLWHLSSKTNIHTFCDQPGFICSLAVYERDGKNILISGNGGGKINLLDLDCYSTIAILQDDIKCINVFCAYDNGERAYLINGSRDGTITIWSLDDYKMLRSIQDNVEIWSLTTMNYDNKVVLASGDGKGLIKLWSLEDYKCITSFKAISYGGIISLEAIRYHGKVCLICPGDDNTINIWDIQNKTVMASLKSDFPVNEIKSFMNDNKACLLSGHFNKGMKLWME